MPILTDKQIKEICAAVRSIASGGKAGPDGLEFVSMALAGEQLKSPVGDGLYAIAEAIDGLTQKVGELAEAVSDFKKAK